MYNKELLIKEAVDLVSLKCKVKVGDRSTTKAKQVRAAITVALRPYLECKEIATVPTHTRHSSWYYNNLHEGNIRGWEGYKEVFEITSAAVDSVFWPVHNEDNKQVIKQRIEHLQKKVDALRIELKENELQYKQKD